MVEAARMAGAAGRVDEMNKAVVRCDSGDVRRTILHRMVRFAVTPVSRLRATGCPETRGDARREDYGFVAAPR